MKMEALALTTLTSTAASAPRGTLIRTVKQVSVVVLADLLKHLFILYSCNCLVRLSCFHTCYVG